MLDPARQMANDEEVKHDTRAENITKGTRNANIRKVSRSQYIFMTLLTSNITWNILELININ